MKKSYGFYNNGKFKVGCYGGSIWVYDQNDNELVRFKGLSYTYVGAFCPGTNIFVAKSTCGTLWIYNLDTLSLFRKIKYSPLGAQDEGFAFSSSGDLFYNIEKPISSTRTQLTVYDSAAFDRMAVYFADEVKMVLHHIETCDNEVYLYGFMRGTCGVYDYAFTARFVNGEVKDIREIKSTEFPITNWTLWGKNDASYLGIYKSWEMHGFTEDSARVDYLIKEPNPPKVTIKQIWQLNERNNKTILS